jgi:hypothetical protein
LEGNIVDILIYLSEMSRSDPQTFAAVTIIVLSIEGVLLGLMVDFIFALFGVEVREVAR